MDGARVPSRGAGAAAWRGLVLSEQQYTIRAASAADAAVVRRIERAAAARYAALGMLEIARGPGMSRALITMFLQRGGLFLMLREQRPVGFVATCVLDGAGHVAEVDVVPRHAGRQLGARLIEHAAQWSRERGCSLLTLTTYRDVPWNAPYYARLGFRECRLEELGREHAQVWEGQRAMGLEMARRVLMSRAL